MTLPEKLEAARAKHGLSWQELAVELGTTYQSLWLYKHGKRTPRTPVCMLLDALLAKKPKNKVL